VSAEKHLCYNLLSTKNNTGTATPKKHENINRKRAVPIIWRLSQVEKTILKNRKNTPQQMIHLDFPVCLFIVLI